MFSFDEDRFYTMPPFFGGSPVAEKSLFWTARACI